MSFGIWNYMAKFVDLTSKRVKSAEAMVKEGDWRFVQLGNYTAASPKVVNSGVKSKITYQLANISYTEGYGLDVSYDYVNQKFMPSTQGDVFQIEVRMKVVPTANDGHMDLIVESPTFGFNPINATTVPFVKGIGQEHFVSAQFLLFIGTDVKTNGIEFYIKPSSANVNVYDVSYFITRISSGKR